MLFHPLSPSAPKSGVLDQHTISHVDCPACERSRSLSVTHLAASLSFATASALWIDSRSFQCVAARASARYLRPNTERSYRSYVRTLNLFFSALRLEQIHLGHLRQYQEARVSGAHPFIRFRRPQDALARRGTEGATVAPKGKTSCPASPKKANQELSVLKMILRRAGCWTPEMQEFYEPFREEGADMPRALTVTEEVRWLEVSRSRPAWWLVHWYSLLAFATGMGTNEMDYLRVGDINLQQGIVNVQPLGAKNRFRARTIDLVGADAAWAATQLLARARDLGSVSPQHMIFPLRQWSSPRQRELREAEFDATRCWTNSGMKRQWDDVRRASGLLNFRRYDTRHTALTRWAEAGMEIGKLMDLSGHLTVRQMRHYARIGESSRRQAMEAVAAKIGPLGCGSPFYVQRKRKA